MTPKEKALAWDADAKLEARHNGNGYLVIVSTDFGSRFVLGAGPTANAAWADAAKTIERL